MKKNKEVQNVLLVSLSDSFTKRVAFALSERLEMFNLNCHDMIVYDLINPKEILEKCGLEYLQKREKGVIENCAGFLNTCISINYELLFKYANLFSKSLLIYINLPYEKITKVPSKLDFNNRNDFLEKIADEVICLDKKSCNNAVEQILNKLGERYENS